MEINSRKATWPELRSFMGDVIAHNPNSRKLWDLITGLRGPDSPSERPDMSQTEQAEAYEGRRKRKAKTVEVIRGHAFGGIVGGSARSRDDRDYVVLPPESEWDHFDKHVARAAHTIGLTVKIDARQVTRPLAKKNWEVKADVAWPKPGLVLDKKAVLHATKNPSIDELKLFLAHSKAKVEYYKGTEHSLNLEYWHGKVAKYQTLLIQAEQAKEQEQSILWSAQVPTTAGGALTFDTMKKAMDIYGGMGVGPSNDMPTNKKEEKNVAVDIETPF